MKSFLNYFASKMIELNSLLYVAIYMFKYFASHIVKSSKMFISILHDKSNFLVFHNFKKYFNSTIQNTSNSQQMF